MTRTIFFLSFCILAVACSKNRQPGKYNSGRLEYKITYLSGSTGNFDQSMLPKKMVLEFNDNFCTNTIDGFMGFFRLGNLTYFHKKKSTTFLKVLDKSYVFYGKRRELMCCFDLFEGMTVKNDSVVKNIAGLVSHHAVVTLPNTGEHFSIFYTYDISLDHPNITNPYLDIDGVLTDFVLFMGPYKMRFEAQKFLPETVPTDDLHIPDDATEVSRNEMVYALERLMK
jgi:hypothetical protein